MSTSSNTSPKILLKRAEISFLKRDYTSTFEFIRQTLVQLRPPRSLTWAIELSPSERTKERQRARAVSLFVTASALRWNETSPKEVISDDQEDTTTLLTLSGAPLFLKDLNDKVLVYYTPSLASDFPSTSPINPQTSIPPPSVIETVSLAGLSIGLPLAFIRLLVEPYLARLDDPIILTTLAQPTLGLAQPSDETWWTLEAKKGYQSLVQLYLLDILAPDGIGGRAEASRLLEWDDCLSSFTKDIIRSKLSTLTSQSPSPNLPPTPLSPLVHGSLSDEEAVDIPYFPPLSPQSLITESKSPVYHPSAMTSLLPSPLASPSSSHASLTSQPTRSASPRPPRANRKRPNWLLILSALPPTAILFLALWSFKKKPSSGLLSRRRLIGLLARLAAVLWRDLVATFRLGTALTYI